MNNTAELQEISYKLLTEFDDICRRHGINYIISGGHSLAR
jgi:phosphorylcholine metabolism protein LicD